MSAQPKHRRSEATPTKTAPKSEIERERLSPAEHFYRTVGISTHFLPAAHGESLYDAIDLMARAGFGGFELVPGDFQGVIGSPTTIRNVGLWPRTFAKRDRARLKDALACFRTVTIHAPHLGVNIASINPGWREESRRQYFECLELALDLSVSTVTFHHGAQTQGFIAPDEEITDHCIAFAREATAFAAKHGLTLGYEVGSFRIIDASIRACHSKRFGVNLDMGHAVMGGLAPEEWVKRLPGRTVEVHVNSVTKDWSGFIEHQPLDRNNVIDHRAVFAALLADGFRGPYIFELRGLDIPDTIDICLRARDTLTELIDSLTR